MRDRSAGRAAVHDVGIVSQQAAYQDYMPDLSRFLHVNAVGTSLLYEIIVQEKLKVKKVIVASSQAVYGEGQYVCSVHGFFQPAPRGQEQLSLGRWDVKCPECDQQAESHLLQESNTNPYNQYAVSKLAQEK